MAATKNKENALEDVALVAGTQQNLSNLYYLDIYGLQLMLDVKSTSNELVHAMPLQCMFALSLSLSMRVCYDLYRNTIGGSITVP